MSVILEPCRSEDLGKIKALYLGAFPEEERAPWWLLNRRVKQGKAELFAAEDDGRFAGMAYVVALDDMAYLFYLAVEEGQRGRGTGTEILAALKRHYSGKRLFLAREQLDSSADNFPQRESRHRFYLSNGLTDMGCCIKESTVTYDVMGTGGKVMPEEYSRLIKGWSGRLVGLFFRAKLFYN